MVYDSLLARSFSKHEQKKLGYGALGACMLIAFSFITILKPYMGPLPFLNTRLSIEADQKLQIVNDTSSSLLIAKDVKNVMNDTVMFNNTSNSQEVIRVAEIVMKNTEKSNNSSSSKQKIGDAEVVMKNHAIVNVTRNSQQIARDVVTKNRINPICNFTERSDFCEIEGDIRIDGKSHTVFIVVSEADILAAANTSWIVRPYARKGDRAAMNNTREWTVKLATDGPDIPQCTQNQSVPAILFSLGGYSGNHFHAFTDIIVPLFSTARPFNGESQLLVTDNQSGWIDKFRILLKALSRYQFIDIDESKDIHCFKSMVVGLKSRSNKELSIDPSTSSYSIKDFRQYLRGSYSLRKATAIKIKDREKKRPRLLIISRKRSRTFTNVGEIAKLAQRLGYKVVVTEFDANISQSATIMNSCDVVMGVHGAGLTNIVFLPENAVLIQVVPFGGAEWISKTYFEEPAKDMNIRYLEYKIKIEESTLMQQYPVDHIVLRDPFAIQKQGWVAYKSIYLDMQNVKIDVNRFRPTLLKALELLHQ